MCVADGQAPDSVTEALRMAGASLDYLNSPAARDLDGAACGEVLTVLGEIQAKFTAVPMARFSAATDRPPPRRDNPRADFRGPPGKGGPQDRISRLTAPGPEDAAAGLLWLAGWTGASRQ